VKIIAEVGAQISYQRKIQRLIGVANALRLRAVIAVSRLFAFEVATISMTPSKALHPVLARPKTSDFGVYYQVFIDEQYSHLNNLNPKLIVDCGANVGYTSAYLLSRFAGARVIAIEPFPDNAALARRNLEPYGERAEIIEAAIWSRSTSLVFERIEQGNEWGISVRQADANEKGNVKAIDIRSLPVDRIDILKVDIEGSEIELFREDADSWLPLVANIVIELHGERCERIFFDALSNYQYDLSQAGELTICRDLRRRAESRQ
jgi:FkbM family methyltransferase